MNKDVGILESDYNKISSKIKEDFYKPVSTYKTSIFLCGADISNKGTIRHQLTEAFSDWLGKIYYDLIFPEDIFDELLYSGQYGNLLLLENLLAESVDVIIVILESAGSIAELGAFANNEKLRSKIICLVEDKYKKDKSFIRQGPIKLIKSVNKSGVIYYDPKSIAKNIHTIKASINLIKKNSTKNTDKISLLQIDNYLLPTIYLLEPVEKSILIKFVGSATNDKVNAFQITTTAIGILLKKKYIELTTNGYKLTILGIQHFLNLKNKGSRIKNHDNTVALDNMRLEILNLQYRKKKLKV